MRFVFKVAPRRLWQDAEALGRFDGSPVDRRDGFIHFSTAEQVAETLARHFAGETDLLLVAIDADALGPALRYEPSRGGALFPHLYGPLSTNLATWVRPLPLDAMGRHEFPALDP